MLLLGLSVVTVTVIQEIEGRCRSDKSVAVAGTTQRQAASFPPMATPPPGPQINFDRVHGECHDHYSIFRRGQSRRPHQREPSKLAPVLLTLLIVNMRLRLCEALCLGAPS
jgi:hypothetical protein